MEFKHETVLLDETINNLKVRSDGIYVDGTLGGAGHSYEIAKKLKTGRLIGIDQDQAAILAATNRLAPYKDKVTIVKSNYSQMINKLKELKIDKVDGIILDLGVSSYQLDNPKRGFSYREDAPLDMRMDTSNPVTAKDIVNDYSEKELYRVIKDYGEDGFAKNIAKHIVRIRKDKPIETTFELVDAIKAAIPMKVRKKAGHPAKKTFQAIRIELNRELEVLKYTIQDMIDVLKPSGRLCIITFHSLEDKIVKSSFRLNENPCICPYDFPVCVCGNKPKGKVITRKPIQATKEELINNKRSRSAKLRVFEKGVDEL